MMTDLYSIYYKIPNDHFISKESLRGDNLEVTYLELKNRIGNFIDDNQLKLLAILLSGLDLNSFTNEEIISLLKINWGFLELRSLHKKIEKFNPFIPYFHSNKGYNYFVNSFILKRKVVSIKQYIGEYLNA